MTRKDYVGLAAAIKQILRARGTADDPSVEYAIDDVANAIADYLAADNPAFDRARFLKACGVQS